jgi:hypothetical protein
MAITDFTQDLAWMVAMGVNMIQTLIGVLVCNQFFYHLLERFGLPPAVILSS